MAEPTIPDNVPTSPDNVPTSPDNVPDNVPDNTPDAPPTEDAPQERPKTRGRPWGSKDAKPRIRRVPVVVAQEEEEEEEEPAAAPAAPAATKKVQIAEPAQHIPEPPRKSPRTLHREHVQALAAERRALAQAKQAHYESLFDRNLSW